MVTNDGGPAFPVECSMDSGTPIRGLQTGLDSHWHTGMTMRQWYAGQAMAGGLPRGDYSTYRDMASDAFAIADAMIEAERATRSDER